MTLEELLTKIKSRQNQDIGFFRNQEYALKSLNSGVFTKGGDLQGKILDSQGQLRGSRPSYPVEKLESFVNDLVGNFIHWESLKDFKWEGTYKKQYEETLIYVDGIAHIAKAKEAERLQVRTILTKWAEKIDKREWKVPLPWLEELLIETIKRHIPKAPQTVIYGSVSKLLSIVGVSRKPETIKRNYNRKKS